MIHTTQDTAWTHSCSHSDRRRQIQLRNYILRCWSLLLCRHTLNRPPTRGHYSGPGLLLPNVDLYALWQDFFLHLRDWRLKTEEWDPSPSVGCTLQIKICKPDKCGACKLGTRGGVTSFLVPKLKYSCIA